MDDANNVVIAMGIGLGIVLLFGIYKLATSRLNASSTLRSGTRRSNSQQTLKAVLTILFSILVFIALFVTWQIFI